MPSLVIGTAGHIDHGKSTLVRALTGIDPDRLKEEKARGITIDLGFAHADIGGVEVAFVDVPGHERFVRNMLAGAGGIDAVLLVIAADESVMPQTREHFEICRLLRVPTGLIALTKSDLAELDTLELSRLETRELVAGSFLEGAPIVPVSAATGAGLDELRRALAAIGGAPTARSGASVNAPVRLPIDRVFSMKGFGTVVTGTLVSGQVRQDDELIAAPGGRAVKIRGLQVHGRVQPSVSAGHRVAANLGGAEVADLSRGDTLISRDSLQTTRRVDAVIELLPTAKPLKHGTRVRFHQGTAERLGRVSIVAARNHAGNRAEPYVAPGREAYVRIRLEAPAVLARGDRFILRAYSPVTTIAGGEVLDPSPPRAGARTEGGRRRFELLDAGARLEDVVASFVSEGGPAGLAPPLLAARVGITPAALSASVRGLEQAGRARDLGGVLVAEAILVQLSRDVLSDLAVHHQLHPLSEGLGREELRTRRFARAHPLVFEAVLERLTAEKAIGGRDRLALASHRVELTDDEQHAREAIEQAFRAAGLKPLSAQELPGALGLQPAVVDRMVKLLSRQRVLVKLDDLLFHADALARLKSEVAALKQGPSGARVDVGSFKEMFDVSRKYAIPLLEYLDRERVTRRVGDSRVVL